MPTALDLIATCARGTQAVLAEELSALGATDVEPRPGAVAFRGPLELAYRACLWSRVASRILLPIARFPAPDQEALYEGVRALPWLEHLDPDRTFAVTCVASRGREANLRFLVLRTKDAVVDAMRDACARRPDVDRHAPDVRIHVHLDASEATVSIDLSGDALHRRGYRSRGAPAPLKETLAAAILHIAGWPALAAEGAPLLDPMCGTGTFLVEAAFMAGDVAPGLLRQRFGFEGWRGHDDRLVRTLREEAQARRAEGRGRIPTIEGRDASPSAVEAAQGSLSAAGLAGLVRVRQGELRDAEPLPSPRTDTPRGLVVTNPPYGERLGEVGALFPLYETLGDVLKHRFGGFTGYVLSGNPALSRHIGLKPARRHVLYNGPIECRLLELPIATAKVRGEGGPAWRRPSPEAEMLANRLRKNLRRLGRWARRENITCYRLYDGDIPEYNVAIDLYDGAAHVQEWARPRSVDPERAEQHLRDVFHVVPDVLGISSDDVTLVVRRRQSAGGQYEKRADQGRLRVVHEGPLRFLVNLTDYLDTGLFLDHRALRRMLRDAARGKRFLNLFAYTCSATVAAAKGGAISSTSVDLSRTYLDWGRRNLSENGVDLSRHTLVRDDCMAYLEHARGPFDLILVAPPIYSRGKRMKGDFDVQRDHAALLRRVGRLLAPGGELYFSTPLHGFELDAGALSELDAREVTRETVPRDFARSDRAHRTFRMTRRR